MKQIFTLVACIIVFYASAQPKQLGTDTIRIEVNVGKADTIVDTNAGNSDFVILDVRTPSEFCTQHIENAINIDYYSPTFGAQLDALDHNKMYLLHCAGGGRSPYARNLMIAKHFREIYHMYQGINAWIAAGHPTIPCFTAIQNINATKLFELYPNPAQNILNIYFESENSGKLFMYDINGKLMKEEQLHSGLQYFDVSGIPQGMYIVKVQSDSEIYTEKVTIF